MKINFDAIAVLGPTASGKTKFAVRLAAWLAKGPFALPAEIISADSRQVYRGMDIGTGKDLADYKDLQSGLEIPYHLIDVAPAGSKYNIFQYQRDFARVYASLRQRGVMPLVCGGSGLYLQAATCRYDLKDVPANAALREDLEKRSVEELAALLVELTAKRGLKPHNDTDFDNKKRAIRAIEIEMAMLEGTPESSMQQIAMQQEVDLPQRVLYMGTQVERDERNRRIDARLKARLQEGMIEEVKGLLESGVPAEDLIYYGLEYKFVTLYLTGAMGREEMEQRLAVAIHQFAKRQMTWFRGMERKGIEIWWIANREEPAEQWRFRSNLSGRELSLESLLGSGC